MIDTPDFDSIESHNRDEAERIFAEADAFVFVTDSLKYADASTWTYLKAIHQARKELLVVLNKVQSDVVVESFLGSLSYHGHARRRGIDPALADCRTRTAVGR